MKALAWRAADCLGPSCPPPRPPPHLSAQCRGRKSSNPCAACQASLNRTGRRVLALPPHSSPHRRGGAVRPACMARGGCRAALSAPAAPCSRRQRPRMLATRHVYARHVAFRPIFLLHIREENVMCPARASGAAGCFWPGGGPGGTWPECTPGKQRAELMQWGQRSAHRKIQPRSGRSPSLSPFVRYAFVGTGINELFGGQPWRTGSR